MIVAGEASGDKHGASLARALNGLYPETRFELFGSGGDEMRAAGVETLIDAREVAIIGVPEIARALGKLYRAYRTLSAAARARRPAAVVLIDWPDFNMRLAKKLHHEGFKIVYYISPQVWAWRRYRIRALRRDVDRLLVILPFEEEFYRRAGVEVEYVGHPLAGAVSATITRDDFCRRYGLDPARSLIALLPGSRHKEIHYHLPVMLDAAIRLRDADFSSPVLGSESADKSVVKSQSSNFKLQIPDSQSIQSTIRSPRSIDQQSLIRSPQFVIPLASTIRPEQVGAAIHDAQHKLRCAAQTELNVKVIEGDAYNALCHSQFAIVASGTATVEAALAGTPMVIIYRGSELNWRLIRPLIRLDTFGMVNLIAGRKIVPELMQRSATGENIAAEASAILSDPSRLSDMRRDLELVGESLAAGPGSGAERAAKAVMGVISRS